jgi:hypothetical protein
VRVLALRVADPDGGPSWGLRIDRTTRGLICVQPGRVQSGEVGVLGIDGAFANDGRFHPFANDYVNPFGCAGIDGNGHAFASVALNDVPASGLALSCEPDALVHSPGAGTDDAQVAPVSLCRAGPLRDIAYGLLGPDALSVTYADARGHLVTEPTSGPDGAFLVVSDAPQHCPGVTFSAHGHSSVERNCTGALLLAGGQLTTIGSIRRVTYRSGRTCTLPATAPNHVIIVSCPLAGYVPRPTPQLSSEQLAAPVSVRYRGLQYLCLGTPGDAPCGAHPPKGSHVARTRYYVVDVDFTARVAVSNIASSYRIALRYPSPGSATCQSGELIGPTDGDFRAGQHVASQQLVQQACTGRFSVTVSYTQTGSRASIPVGHTTFTLPPARHHA